MSMLMLLLDPPKTPDSLLPVQQSKDQYVLRRGRKKGDYEPRCEAANKARQEQAQARYKAAMGDGWKTTEALHKTLKFHRRALLETLRGYEKKGLVERRPFNDEPYNNRKGWEWRWKK